MSSIGNRIRTRREQLNLSQDELAKRLGYKSRSSINKIELDERNLTQSKIKSIADALETTPSYIMGWESKSGETDLGLAYLDIAKMLESTPDKVEAIMDGMVFPDGITLSALEEISYRLNNPAPSFKLLSASFESLNDEGRERLINYADDLVSSGKYKK